MGYSRVSRVLKFRINPAYPLLLWSGCYFGKNETNVIVYNHEITQYFGKYVHTKLWITSLYIIIICGIWLHPLYSNLTVCFVLNLLWTDYIDEFPFKYLLKTKITVDLNTFCISFGKRMQKSWDNQIIPHLNDLFKNPYFYLRKLSTKENWIQITEIREIFHNLKYNFCKKDLFNNIIEIDLLAPIMCLICIISDYFYYLIRSSI